MTASFQQSDVEQEIEVLRRQLEEVTDAFVAANDQLLALYRLTDFSSITLDGSVAIQRIVNETLSVLQADRAMFLTRADDGSLSIVASATAMVIPRGIEREHQQAWLGSEFEVESDEPWIDHDEPANRSRLRVPVRMDDEANGLLVAEVHDGQRFTTADLKLAGALANQLAMMLAMSSLHDNALHRTLIERDYETASALAQAALKRSLPEVPGLELAALNRSARAAGGDFYAALRSRNGLYLAVGDVSGKGLPAAMIMATAISATYESFERSPTGDVGAVLTDIDRQLSSYLIETGMFVTMAVAHIDSASLRLDLTNAGQSPVSLIQNGMKTSIPAHGPPVGVLPPRVHEVSSWAMSSDALLFLGTDGWTDQENEHGEMFGDDSLDAILASESVGGATAVLDALVLAVDTYAAGTDQADDLTAIIVSCGETGAAT